MPIDDPAEFLGALLQAKVKRPDTEAMTDKEMVGRLMDVFIARDAKERFLPGQVIVHKYPDVANTKNAGRPAIFAGYLDEPVKMWELPGLAEDAVGTVHMASIHDCKILKFAGGHVVEFLEDSRDYTLHPDFQTKN